MSNRNNSRLKTVSLVILITLMSKVLGLGRDMLQGQTFGTGFEADALAAASLLPRLFFDAVFASAVSASFIPVFNEVLEREGRDEAFRLAGSFFTVVGLAAATVTVFGMAFSSDLLGLIGNFANPKTAVLASRLLQIIFPSLFLAGLAFSMVGVLNSFGEFNIPAAMSLVSNAILILYFLFFAGRFGVYGAAVALLIGWVAQALMQVPSLRKTGFRYRPSLWHPGLRKIFKLMPPVMVSTWVLPINMLIMTFWFGATLPGGASSLNLANGLYMMIAGVFVLSVTNVIFPEMSRLSVAGDRGALCDLVRETLRTLLFLLIPMTVGLMLLATPLVRLLYEHGAFCAQSTELKTSALFFMSIGMVGYGIQTVLFRAFYAEKRGKIPLLSGLLSVVTTFTLCFLLVERMGVAGLGLASAASFLVTTLVLVPAAHRMLDGRLVTRALILALGKMVIAALIMGFAVYFLRDVLASALGDDNVPARLTLVGIPAALGVTLYMALAYVFRLDEIKTVFAILRRRGKGEA